MDLKNRLPFLALMAVLAVVAAGCGDDESSDAKKSEPAADKMEQTDDAMAKDEDAMEEEDDAMMEGDE